MTKAFDKMKTGFDEAIAFANGDTQGAIKKQFHLVDIKHLRSKLKFTQVEFARLIDTPIASLKHWERGDRIPPASTRTLFDLINNNPDLIVKELEKVRELKQAMQ